jgi:hypothetical protein
MFSGSNSYLGGGNSARPGQPPYSQQQQQQQQQYGQPGGFQGGLGPQPTGFGGAPMQPQFTGYPGQPQGFGQQQQQPPLPQVPQYTGYPGQQSQFQQPQAPQQQPFQTGAPPQQPMQQPPAQPQRPQPTGMTSSQMADSFRVEQDPKHKTLVHHGARPGQVRAAVQVGGGRFAGALGRPGAGLVDALKALGRCSVAHLVGGHIMRNRTLLIDSGLCLTPPSPASSFSPNLRLPCISATSN